MVESVGLSECLKTFSAKDESNEPSVALYKKGLNEFEKALQVPIPGHGLNQDKANELKSRIRRSVIQIKERVFKWESMDGDVANYIFRQYIDP